MILHMPARFEIKRSISEIHDAPNKDNPNRVHLFMNDGNEVYASIPLPRNGVLPGIAAKMKQKGVVNLEVGAYCTPLQNNSF